MIGGHGRGLATAYYVAKTFGIRNVAVLEKGWLGSGNIGCNTTITRSNDLLPGNNPFYEFSMKLWEGLEQDFSQNHWPSLDQDIGALTGLLSPFLSAGFYYKTFMWPAAFWEKVYEPRIPRAAGLGRAGYEADPECYEKLWAYCDLLVVGAGPAGLAAALTAGRVGAEVMIVDEAAEAAARFCPRPRASTVRRLKPSSRRHSPNSPVCPTSG